MRQAAAIDGDLMYSFVPEKEVSAKIIYLLVFIAWEVITCFSVYPVLKNDETHPHCNVEACIGICYD